MRTLPISVCIIAKNEERYLEGCLKKLIPYGFEIVVVDTGSTDRTREIAKSYTKHVYSFSWINDFSAARNFAAQKASNDWILSLDCDEYIQECDPEDLLEFQEKHPKKAGVIRLENRIQRGKGIGKSLMSLPRYYNKNFAQFEGMIHEQIRETDGSPIDHTPISLSVIHYGYVLSEEELRTKNERNISLLLKAIEEEPDEPYYYFQLGQSYAMLDDYETVFQYLSKGLSLNPDPNQEYTQQMLIDYGTSMLYTKRYELALKVELLYDTLCEYSDYLFLLGRIYHANNMLMEALTTFLKATAAPKCISYGTNSYFPLHNMALIYEQLGEQEMADSLHERVKELTKDFGYQDMSPDPL